MNTAAGSEVPLHDAISVKTNNGRMAIVLPDGRWVIVGRDVTAAALRRLLDVLWSGDDSDTDRSGGLAGDRLHRYA